MPSHKHQCISIYRQLDCLHQCLSGLVTKRPSKYCIISEGIHHKMYLNAENLSMSCRRYAVLNLGQSYKVMLALLVPISQHREPLTFTYVVKWWLVQNRACGLPWIYKNQRRNATSQPCRLKSPRFRQFVHCRDSCALSDTSRVTSQWTGYLESIIISWRYQYVWVDLCAFYVILKVLEHNFA